MNATMSDDAIPATFKWMRNAQIIGVFQSEGLTLTKADRRSRATLRLKLQAQSPAVRAHWLSMAEVFRQKAMR